MRQTSNSEHAIEGAMSKKGEALGHALNRLQSHFGDVQLIVRSAQFEAVEISNTPSASVQVSERTQVLVRRFGQKSTAFQQAGTLDLETLVCLLEKAPRIPPSGATLPLPGQQAAGLDLRLHRTLADPPVLLELANALRSNALHEAERCAVETRLTGSMRLWRQVTFVGANSEVVGAFQGSLDARVEMNGLLGDRVAQVHAPESFLPIALIGARSLQRYGHLAAVDASSLSGLSKVVLHPRALETLLRRFALNEIRATLLNDPEIVGCDGLFLVDDPTIEGLWTARGFDDTGAVTARQALVLRGQVASRVLSSRTPGQEWFHSPLDDQGFESIPSSRFSGILVGRGESSLHDILIESRLSVVVNEWSVSPVHGQLLGFKAEVIRGILMRGERPVGLIAPGTLSIQGTVFGEGGSVFSGGRLSRELQDTGSAVAPFVQTSLRPAR